MSRNPRKNKATGNTKPTISPDHFKVGPIKTTSAPSPYHSKGVTRQKTTASVSRNHFKVEHWTTTQSVSRSSFKENASPTSRKTAQVPPHNVVKMEREKTKSIKSQTFHADEMKIESKNKDMKGDGSARNISATSVIINASSTQSIPKQSQINEHLARLSPVTFHTVAMATAVLPSTLHVLKKPFLVENKTSVFVNSTEKFVPSTQVITQSRTTSHSIQPKPRLTSSLIFYSTASTSAFGGSSSYGKDLKNNLQNTTDNVASCNVSEILQDVSPPIGKETSLGPVPDMRTCIQLAFDVDGDVACMRSSHCFAITCHSRALCEASDQRLGGSDVTSTIAFLRKRGHPYKGM